MTMNTAVAEELNLTYMISLDISHELTEAEVTEFASPCEATLVEEFGPAGGNPVYVFSSNNEDNLFALACEVLQTEDHSWVESMIEIEETD